MSRFKSHVPPAALMLHVTKMRGQAHQGCWGWWVDAKHCIAVQAQQTQPSKAELIFISVVLFLSVCLPDGCHRAKQFGVIILHYCPFYFGSSLLLIFSRQFLILTCFFVFSDGGNLILLEITLGFYLPCNAPNISLLIHPGNASFGL